MDRTHKIAVWAGLAVAVSLYSACDINDGQFEGEFNAGGADPYNFPPPYRSGNPVSKVCTGSTSCLQRERAGNGKFNETAAFAKKNKIGYFAFPFGPAQLATTGYQAPDGRPPPNGLSPGGWPEQSVDPLRIAGPGTDWRAESGNPLPVPQVYNFDPPGTENPFAPSFKCRVPAGYKFDPYRDGVTLAEQWNIFTFLPDRFTRYPFGEFAQWNYRPIVAEVPVTTNKLDCQAVKSERTLLQLADSGNVSMPRGELELDKKTRLGLATPNKYLAWALIDPGSPVLRPGEKVNINSGGTVNGTSVQKYGWYGQFIVAYIDGGYIPVEEGPEVKGLPTKRMRPQRLYYPRSQVLARAGAAPSPGALGAGYDVLQANRFEDPAAYSPVCEVWTYSTGSPVVTTDLPKDEATIIEKYGATLEPARTEQTPSAYNPSIAIVPRYLFCLQAAPLPQTTP